MLYRKIGKYIKEHLLSNSDKILIIEGARQIGKSFIIRETGKSVFKNFIEINLAEDDNGEQFFKNIRTTESFYLALSSRAGASLNHYEDTLVFIDEIQQYPQFLTLLKFLREEKRYHFIASGSLLGLTLRSTTSIPIGSIIRKPMFQLDFEEFLLANGFGRNALLALNNQFNAHEPLTEELHRHLLGLFRRYLLIGGMPDAVNTYLETHNIVKVREIHNSILSLYGDDAAKYEKQSQKNLLIRRIYGMIPSQMENKKKRIVAKDIRDRKGDRYAQYQEEFEYLISAGIALDVQAITNPTYPLRESSQKNLLKLYLNDVGLLTSQLYHNNIRPVLEDESSVNLGAVYESVVAQELRSKEHYLFYYDNRKKGEVDFLIDDYADTGVIPIEVKSGKDYSVHSALNNLLSASDYRVSQAMVLSNERKIEQKGKILYMPIYFLLFIGADDKQSYTTF